MKRQIIRIDEDKCNGCGLCVPSCAEGSLQIINGKARLIADKLCDGLGACLGECPQGALIIEEREAEAFDEQAVHAHLQQAEKVEPLACACPGSMARTLAPGRGAAEPVLVQGDAVSELGQWPVKLKLVNPAAAYFKNAELLVAADCVPFAFANFHQSLLRGHALAISCPKLDETVPAVEKLAEIISINALKSITVAHMEVPCCNGLISIVRAAVQRAGVNVPLEAVRISLEGTVMERKQIELS
ncbi:MAG: 4Fe-4S binding protein [Dethiobacter sp.]|jgi:NAD-dependent dihydropyrimidine dehydrogenase PreA subunit|nr:4Fe-4S binding protein [Dethiobacter sp.]MBS3898741.1 4Fe-4S binding protein [Dethiobacter sp.]MBS3983575.1 4Fe-4S binding protein [Dethiobacter sp.]MCL4462589.1 4Fe-4S binding protein [Bacillota bacterium]